MLAWTAVAIGVVISIVVVWWGSGWRYVRTWKVGEPILSVDSNGQASGQGWAVAAFEANLAQTAAPWRAEKDPNICYDCGGRMDDPEAAARCKG